MPQAPFAISGTVTVNSSLYHGAQLWLRDLTEGTITPPVDDITYVYTNALGQFLLDLANNTSAYANGDTVRVYCKVGNMITFSDITINKTEGMYNLNFTFTRKSALVDGVRDSPSSDNKGGLYSNALQKGCSDGLQ